MAIFQNHTACIGLTKDWKICSWKHWSTTLVVFLPLLPFSIQIFRKKQKKELKRVSTVTSCTHCADKSPYITRHAPPNPAFITAFWPSDYSFSNLYYLSLSFFKTTTLHSVLLAVCSRRLMSIQNINSTQGQKGGFVVMRSIEKFYWWLL